MEAKKDHNKNMNFISHWISNYETSGNFILKIISSWMESVEIFYFKKHLFEFSSIKFELDSILQFQKLELS